jgi:hypothetical protein
MQQCSQLWKGLQLQTGSLLCEVREDVCAWPCCVLQVLTTFQTLSTIWQPSSAGAMLERGAAAGQGATTSAAQKKRVLLQVQQGSLSWGLFT